jgi:hypothetical protein
VWSRRRDGGARSAGGRLAWSPQPGSDLGPPDAQANSLVDQLRECHFCPLSAIRVRSICSSTWAIDILEAACAWSGARPAPDRGHSSDVREWAKQQGIKVSERGRIPASVVAGYEAAH